MLQWLYFRMDGRLGRAAFLLAFLLLGIVQSFPLYRHLIAAPDSTAAQIWSLAFVIVLVVSLYSMFAIGVKRLHDLGRSGFEAIWLFVPVVSIIVFVLLCIVPGEDGPNKFGPRTDAPV